MYRQKWRCIRFRVSGGKVLPVDSLFIIGQVLSVFISPCQMCCFSGRDERVNFRMGKHIVNGIINGAGLQRGDVGCMVMMSW